MNPLIEELKKEHREITNVLTKLQDPQVPFIKKIEYLNKSKEMLLTHLSKEDKELYPFLREKAKTDPILQQTLDSFGKEMDIISDFVIKFYEKYSDINTLPQEFIKDLSKLIVTLKNRILKEEIAIYKKYEEYHNISTF